MGPLLLRTGLLLVALSLVWSQTTPVTTVTYDTRACQPPNDAFPFCDTSLSLDDRVSDLVSRLLSPEIVPQLTARHGGGGSPGPDDNVTRLGLPEFDWGMNAIHGVQSSCIGLSDGSTLCPSSFPNPVNFGMTWNRSLFYDLGAVIGIETRALWLAGAVEASTWSGRPHIGLDAWSPNININRDPRWGRNVEVPGEDPLYNGIFGQLYTQGIQFNAALDPKYLQAVVTLKHWDAYSLEDSDGFTRHNFNAVVSPYGLADTFFPAFKRAVMVGGAKGVMCSYNSLNGVPTCANPFLSHVLRDVWGFEGYQTSDSGALEDIYQQHKYVATVEEAACAAIRNGTTDVCSGTTFADGLLKGIAAGYCTNADVMIALTNTFKLRFQLGLFDPAETQPLWHVPTSAINTTATQALNMLATLSSFVLLKNDKSTLPFPKGRTVAVIGPHAMSQEDLAGNYLGQLCPDNSFDCIVSPFAAISSANTNGATHTTPGCAITGNDTSGYAAAVSLAKASDYVVMMVGIDGSVEGESKDRTSIDLPSVQHDLISAVLAAGKPVAVVLINGGMVDVSTEKADAGVGAIIEAGYPGMLGGLGIAATLFGDNAHLGGKLPYTMYPASYVDTIPMSEMEMDVGPGRSYRYYNGSVVYPFGWGLSYTSFNLVLTSSPGPAVAFTTGCPSSSTVNLTFTVQVTNTGTRAGDEVVFAFFSPILTPPNQSTNRLLRQLFDFERVHLEAGASTTLTFTASVTTLQLVDKNSGDIISTAGWFNILFANGVDQSLVGTTIKLSGPDVVCDKFPVM